jgi:hypothetical protein
MHQHLEGRGIPPAWLQRFSTWQIAGIGISVMGICALAATLVAPLAADITLGLAGSLALVAAGWGVASRRQLAQLPLELGEQVYLQERDGGEMAHVRVRLGLGRTVRAPSATAQWHGPDGSVAVEVLVPHTHLCGPWTLLVPVGQGDLEVEVTVHAAGQEWQASRRWSAADICSGRFAAGFSVARGRVRVDHGAWAAGESSTTE